MSTARITAVVPTWNSSGTLDWTLLSLRKQRDCEVDIGVVDSGSTDGTLDICTHWGIVTSYEAPGNMYRAINAGLRQSSNEWLAYLNSDDWVYPDSYSRLVAKGEATGADIVYGDCDYIDSSGRFLYSFASARPDQLLSLFRTGVLGFAQPAAIFRRRVYEQLNGFDEQYSLSSDADFYLRATLTGAAFSRIGGASVACFRLHNKQLSNIRANAMKAEKRSIHARLGGTIRANDWMCFASWRVTNWPHYLIRIVRASLSSGRLRLSRSMDSYNTLAK